MDKLRNIILFIFVIILCGLSFVLFRVTKKQDSEQENKQPQIVLSDNNPAVKKSVFTDGLPTPDATIKYTLDEFGMGPSTKNVYYIDIDNNGTLDRITKTFVETGNAHSYYKYTIEIKEGDKFIDITPDNFQTTNGVICDLQQIQFRFEPQFMVKLIYRELGDLWDEPTIAKQKTFMLSGNSWQTYPEKKLKPICDVKELF